jgi:hypothetical protein
MEPIYQKHTFVSLGGANYEVSACKNSIFDRNDNFVFRIVFVALFCCGSSGVV